MVQLRDTHDLPYIFQRVSDGVVEHTTVVPLDTSVPVILYMKSTLRIGLEPTMTLMSAGSLGLTDNCYTG